MPTYKVTFEMVDAYGRAASKTFETVSSMADETAALAAAASLATALANLTELDILAYSVGQRIVYTDTADAGANRDEGVTFTLRKADNYKAPIKVPGPVNSIFDIAGNVDLTDGIVTAFINNFLTGASFTFSDGEQASAVVSGTLDK